MVVSYQSYLKGPRWAFGVHTIYEFAGSCNLIVDAVQEHKGWATKTVTFTVSGSQENINSFKFYLSRAVAQYNAL